MVLLKRFLLILCAAAAVLAGAGQSVQAENADSTVKEAYESPQKSEKADSEKKKADETKRADETGNAGITAWDFIRTIAALIFILALIYLLLRFVGSKNKNYQKVRSIENLGGTALGSNRSIQLIKVGSRILIVGVGENIQLLKEIEDPVEYSQLLNQYNDKMDQMIQPRDLLSRLLNKKKTGGDKAAGFAEQLSSQLEEMAAKRKQALKELVKKGSSSDE